MEKTIEAQIQPQHNRNMKFLALFMAGAGILFIVAAVVFVFWLQPVNRGSDSSSQFVSAVPVELNFAAPELKLNDLLGNPVSLADYRGQVILINNWAFWCLPCREELPVLQEFYKDHQKQNFTIIGIESGGEFKDVDYFVKQFHLTYPVWLDPEEKAITAFKDNAYPTSYVVDPDGQVIMGWSGPISREMLEKHVAPLLEK